MNLFFQVEQLELQKKQRKAEQKRVQPFRADVSNRMNAIETSESQGPCRTFESMDIPEVTLQVLSAVYFCQN